MRKFKFKINGNQYDANIVSMEDNLAEVDINGTIYQVEVNEAMQMTKTPKLVRSVAVPSTDSHPSVAKTSSPSGPKGGGTVKSPLPGVVLDVFVKEGDTVSIGQKLLVLEAMKMENNITSEFNGKVINIFVKPGEIVPEGAPLVEIAHE